MVFSSLPVNLDHSNWHHQSHDHVQQPNHQPPPSQPGVAGESTRPGSMVDRARRAKIPLPEAGLKCPRCESTNSKFCYFNNYNLSQPRHFCKACRRYWTRGGALRNVPVGGGCRKTNKRKNKTSKLSHHQVMITSANSTPPSSCTPAAPIHFPTLPPPQWPFMAALESFPQCGSGSSNSGFQSGSSNILSVGETDHWRLPFLAGLEPQVNFDPYQSEGIENGVKMEENQNQLGFNLSRQLGGVSENNHFSWVGNANTWAEISGLNLSSSTTSHLLFP